MLPRMNEVKIISISMMNRAAEEEAAERLRSQGNNRFNSFFWER